jgi:hypothetical protein
VKRKIKGIKVQAEAELRLVRSVETFCIELLLAVVACTLVVGCGGNHSQTDYISGEFLSKTKLNSWDPRQVKIGVTSGNTVRELAADERDKFQTKLLEARLPQGDYAGGIALKAGQNWIDVGSLTVSYGTESVLFEVQYEESLRVGRLRYRTSSGRSYYFFRTDVMGVYFDELR